MISLLAEALLFAIPDEKIECLCRLKKILSSTTVDERTQFTSGLTGNNPMTMPKNGILTAGYCDLCE